MRRARAEIVHEYGPFPDAKVAGVTYDGRDIWFGSDDKLTAIDTATGEIRRSLDTPAPAGTTFDGKYLYKIADDRIHKLNPATGAVVGSIPTPAGGGHSGLAWAEGSLWIGQYRERKIHQVDPATGAVLRTIESNRFVTGVAWVDGEMWHGTWEDDKSEIRRVDAATGEVAEVLEMPEGLLVSGLDSDRADRLFCGGGTSGKVRVVRRPKRA
jgi:streptogramin lyase